MCILAVDFYVEEESHSYCVEIEKSPKKTKKLRFGPAQLLKKIEFLSSQEGYCWAEDKHFAQEFDVDISTINRWIRTLKEFELIKTESKNVLTANGWIRRRKTYVLKKSLRNPQNKGPATLNVEGSMNKPIKEERMNEEKSSSFFSSKEKPSNENQSDPLYDRINFSFKNSLKPQTYKRWRKVFDHVFLGFTLANLHQKYKGFDSVAASEIEKLAEASLQGEYYIQEYRNSYGNGALVRQKQNPIST